MCGRDVPVKIVRSLPPHAHNAHTHKCCHLLPLLYCNDLVWRGEGGRERERRREREGGREREGEEGRGREGGRCCFHCMSHNSIVYNCR